MHEECDSKGCGWLWDEEESEKEELQRLCKQLLHCTLTSRRKPTAAAAATTAAVNLDFSPFEDGPRLWTCTDSWVEMEVEEAGETTAAATTSWYETRSTLNYFPPWLLLFSVTQGWTWCVGGPSVEPHLHLGCHTWNLWPPLWRPWPDLLTDQQCHFFLNACSAVSRPTLFAMSMDHL